MSVRYSVRISSPRNSSSRPSADHQPPKAPVCETCTFRPAVGNDVTYNWNRPLSSEMDATEWLSGEIAAPVSRIGPLMYGFSAPPAAGNSHRFCAVTGSSCVIRIHFPSGDHASGLLNNESERYSGRSGDASPTVSTNRSAAPPASAAKTTWVPSGDHVGTSLRPGAEVSGTAPPRARSTSQIPDSDADIDRTSTACVPSGAIATLS